MQDTGGDDEDQDSEKEDVGADPLGNEAGSVTTRKQQKKTQTERNRQKRKRDADLAVQERQELKKQRRELDRVKDIVSELSTEEQTQAAHAARKAVTRAEKALSLPPRLGKHKFEPPSVQVSLFDP